MTTLEVGRRQIEAPNRALGQRRRVRLLWSLLITVR
jgi:hypothetical protein